MRKLLHTLLALLILAGTTTVTSCLSSEDDNIIQYSDCAITSFSLGTLNKYRKTVSSTTGNDTIIKSNVTGSLYKFTIDQKKRLIYNVDSLPAGTDSLRVLCNIGTRNGGYVFIKSAKSDSIFSYTSTDSISFEKNPRTFVIVSNDGQYEARYDVQLRIHQEESNKMSWSSPYTATEFAGADILQTTEWNGNILVKTLKDGHTTLYASAIGNGKTWNAIAPDKQLSTKANIAVLGNMLYTTDADGKVLKSTDGQTWEAVNESGITGNVIGKSNGKIYILADVDGGNGLQNIVSYDAAKDTKTLEAVYDNEGCSYDMDKHISLCEIVKDKKTTGSVIIGFENSNIKVMYKAENTAEQQKWMFLDNDAQQNLPNSYCETVQYGNYLLSLANGVFYTSIDNGLSWQKRSFLYAPDAIKGTEKAHLLADSRGTLWIITTDGQIYRGKYNEYSWK